MSRRLSMCTSVLTIICSVLEIHTFLVTLLANFEFALPENGKKIIGYRSMAVVPAVEGETHKGAQLLLKVSSVGPG